MSRGLRNCNLDNIRIKGDKFQGEVIPSQDKAFKQFISMAFGYRAMCVDLSTRQKKCINTIHKIIYVWASPNEKNTELYINTVVKSSGVSKDKILTGYNGDEYIKIVVAMSRIENGIEANMTDVIAGFNLQSRIKKVV